ncbi:putative heme iron utilization protein [Ancylobacter sp. 3268]|uniref:HugZ family pyridoxamine 5'-phosphate oxidase n=1 Tax=Ancylobacter sp. 3268 TaxID=2817752 RepID=UPI0028664383|nr:DUF2470 domain-containing protein [Ancylobacter sp. 3268]MDR6954601.1 putative heme iron utilization protein [Ancylobacter sp. 3268]
MNDMNASGFDAAASVKRLLRETRTGALASLDRDGWPYASLVQLATLHDGSPILLLSQLARHTRNIAGDRRVSLLIDERREGDELQGARASLKGHIFRVEGEADIATARRRFLARHADSAGFADFADFAFYRIEPESAHLVAGFGRIAEVPAADFLTSLAGAEEALASEEGAIAHMNADHADAIGLYATALLGAAPGAWRMTGIDPEGCDLMSDHAARRLPFDRRMASAHDVHRILVELAVKAREIAGVPAPRRDRGEAGQDDGHDHRHDRH